MLNEVQTDFQEIKGQERISVPLLTRIDIHIEMPRIE